MIFQDAYDAAQDYLDANIRQMHEVEIVIGSCVEHSAAWVFAYNTRRFYAEADLMSSLVGNGPIVVPKGGEGPFLASPALPVEEQLRYL